MKTKTELLEMFAEKTKQLQEGTSPQLSLMLNIELILLIDILGDDLPAEYNETN